MLCPSWTHGLPPSFGPRSYGHVLLTTASILILPRIRWTGIRSYQWPICLVRELIDVVSDTQEASSHSGKVADAHVLWLYSNTEYCLPFS